jgi:CBS domain-containing protein
VQVREIMTIAPVTVGESTPVVEVARQLLAHQLPGLPVVDPQGRVLGMVTEEDLIMRNANLRLPHFLTILDALIPTDAHEFDEEVRRMLATSAAEVMTSRPPIVSPDDDVADAATLMVEHHLNPVPVVENERVVGLLTRRDIVRLMLREEDAAAGVADTRI